jgi:hypothetical protein
MASQALGLKVAATVFGIMALAQAGRLILRPEISVNGWTLPLWPSMIAVVFLSALSAWLWKLARR